MTTAYISHPACLQHETGSDHPESPRRLYAIEDTHISDGLMNLLKRLDAPRATREQLCRVHSPVYLDEIEHRAPKSGLITLDADTVMGPESREAASRAAGAMVQGVDMIMDSHHIVHAPLDAGAYSDEFQQPVQDHLIPALHRFRPELILVSAGFDSHFEDAMGQLNLLDSDYYWITRRIMEVAAQYAEGHVVTHLKAAMNHMPWVALLFSIYEH